MSQATDTRSPERLLVQECPPAQALATMGSSLHGLSPAEAADRLAAHGRNELVHPPHASVLRRFLEQFTDLFAVMLLVAAAITFAAYLLSDPRDTGSLQLAIAILAVVLLNAVIGFMQEY